MTFEKFCTGIADFLAIAGTSAVFGIDDKGRYIARTPDGIRFSGNSVSRKITVRYGDKHQMMFSL